MQIAGSGGGGGCMHNVRMLIQIDIDSWNLHIEII